MNDRLPAGRRPRDYVRLTILAGAVTALWGAPSLAQPLTSGGGASHPGSRAPQTCTYGQACRLTVGLSVSWSVTTFCHDNLGNPIDDTVTLTATGYPTTGSASLSIRPNPMHTFTNAVILLRTTADTQPNNYDIAVSGEGVKCGHYTFNPPSTPLELVKPVPANFHQAGPGTVKPDAVLHFAYLWDSSTGNLADLDNCQVGEKVGYPGSGDPYTWPSPPYSGSTADPTILWVPATDGVAQDDHSHVAFLAPYAENRFVARQDYRYKCKFGSKIEFTDFSGWTGIAIARTVKDSTGKGCFRYKITKSGDDASERLPGVTQPQCTQSPASIVELARNSKVTSDQVDLSISLPDTSVGLNEPVFADLTVVNREAQNVEIDLGLNRKSNLELTVWPPDGTVKTRSLGSGGFGRSGRVSLVSGGSFKERLLLNEWYKFLQTGPYRMKITLSDASSAASDRASQEFFLQVHPRDPAHLSLIADKLADTAVMGATLAERMDAANALSYTVDPLAVPSLRRVLQQGSLVEHYAVTGLGRIGSPDAIAALKAAQNNPDEDVRSQVRSVLRSIQAQSSPRTID
jgi:PBS lyase HEAT-like repeat